MNAEQTRKQIETACASTHERMAVAYDLIVQARRSLIRAKTALLDSDQTLTTSFKRLESIEQFPA